MLFKERYYPATNLGAVKEQWEGKVARELTGYWNTPQTLVGVAALAQRELALTVAYLKPGVTAHPLMAAPGRVEIYRARGGSELSAGVRLRAPVQTRGLRVVPAKPSGSIAYTLGGPVVLLAALEEQQTRRRCMCRPPRTPSPIPCR